MPNDTAVHTAQWIIPLLLVLPVVWAFGLMLPIKALDKRRVAWTYSAITSSLSFAMALFVTTQFDWENAGTMQMHAEFVWVPQMGLTFSYGLDGISIWLMLLNTFLMPVVVVSSLLEVNRDMRVFHFWLHILEAALIGTFIAQDALMFYACFEFTIIPLYFLINHFGHGNRRVAASTFFYYTFTGSVFILAAILYVAWVHATHLGSWSFHIPDLYNTATLMSATEQSFVFLGFLIGFAFKTPLFPFHTWLPLAHTEAPTAGSVDLAGLVLKLGPYGLLRMAIPFCPMAAVTFAPYIGALAVIGVIYAGLICWVQTDAKKLVAYSSVSHMGFCIIGLFAFDDQNIGAVGAMMYMLSHGVATGGLFLCIGMLYDRFGTRDLRKMQGLGRPMPMFVTFILLFAITSVGLPGLAGFPGEFLTMLGTFDSPYGILGPTYAIAAATGIVIGAIYLLFLVGRLAFGPAKIPELVIHYVEDPEEGVDPHHRFGLSHRELAALMPMAVMCVVFGLFPGSILNSLEDPVDKMLTGVTTEIVDRQLASQSQDEAADQTADAADAAAVTPDDDITTTSTTTADAPPQLAQED